MTNWFQGFNTKLAFLFFLKIKNYTIVFLSTTIHYDFDWALWLCFGDSGLKLWILFGYLDVGIQRLQTVLVDLVP